MQPSMYGNFIPSSVPIIDQILDNSVTNRASKNQSESYKTNSNGSLYGISQTEQTLIPNQYTADRDPTPDDNYYDGWREGSKWYNIVSNKVWLCAESIATHTLWRLIDNVTYISETVQKPFIVTNIGGTIWQIVLDQDLMIKDVTGIYIDKQCRIASGWNFDPNTLAVVIDTVNYPKADFSNTEAYITCTRIME